MRLEASSGENWRKNRYVFEALKAAIDVILAQPQLQLEAVLEVPAWIKLGMTNRDDQFREPEGFGSAIALGLWSELLISDKPPRLDHPKNVHYADHFWSMPKWRKDLGLKPREKSS